MFEKVIDDAAELTGWDTDTKYSLVLDFLENYCPEKLDDFENIIDSISTDELGSCD